MADYIYARVSTLDQSVDPQTYQLQIKYPNVQVITEIASGAKSRPILRALCEQLKRGDRLIVVALDRLGRRTTDVLCLLEDLERRGVIFISEREAIDFSTPIGRMTTSLLAAVAQLEKENLSARTIAGIAAARARGSKIGRPRTISDATIKRAVRKVLEGKQSINQTAKEFGISYPTLSIAVRSFQIQLQSGPK